MILYGLNTRAINVLGNCTKYPININLPKQQIPWIFYVAFHHFIVFHNGTFHFGWLLACTLSLLSCSWPLPRFRSPVYEFNNGKTYDRISWLVVNKPEYHLKCADVHYFSSYVVNENRRLNYLVTVSWILWGDAHSLESFVCNVSSSFSVSFLPWTWNQIRIDSIL